MRLWPRRQVYLDDLPKTHDIRFATLFMLLVVALLGALYTVGFFVAGDRLARGTSVAGIDVGGMRRDEARATLEDELTPKLATTITATAMGKTFAIKPERAGLTFDIDATLQAGLGSSRWDPAHMLDVVMGGEALDPVVDVDQATLDRTLQRVADAVNVRAADSSVSFAGGRPKVVVGHDGTQLDFDASAQALRDAVLSGAEEVTFPVQPVEPHVTAHEATAFAANVATHALSGPVRVRVADVVRTVPVKVFAPTLRVTSADGELALTADADALRRRSAPVLGSLPHRPSNARIVFRNGRPGVVPSTTGVSVSADDWAAAVLRAARSDGQGRIARAHVTPDPPAFDTHDARGLKVDQRLASATLPVVRGIDADAVRKATARLDGYLLRPIDDFTFLGRVGGAEEAADSLVASAVYAAAFHAGMSNIYRSAPRTSTIGSEPGLDATIGQGVDLAWVNQTPYGVYVRATMGTDGSGRPAVTVALWGHPYWNVDVTASQRYNVVAPATDRQSGPQCRARRGVAGYDVDVSRRIARRGEATETEQTHSHYEVVDAVVCRGR